MRRRHLLKSASALIAGQSVELEKVSIDQKQTNENSTTSSSLAAQSSDGAWRMFGGNPANTGHNPNISGPQEPVTWTANTGDVFSLTPTSPAIANNTVFVGDRSGTVHALNVLTGEHRWTSSVDGFELSSPVVSDGMVFVTGHRSGKPERVYALEADTGDLQWETETPSGANIILTPAIADDIVFCGGDRLQALKITTGELRWDFKIQTADFMNIKTPITVFDETAFFGATVSSEGDQYIALDISTGDLKWRSDSGWASGFLAKPVAVDDSVYFGLQTDTNQGCICAVSAETGSELWRFDRLPDSAPAVANESVFVGDTDGYLYAINAASGEQFWRFEMSTHISGSPSVANGTVFAGDWNGNVYAIDTNSGELQWTAFDEWWEMGGGPIDVGKPAVVDNTVFIQRDNKLWALDASTGARTTGLLPELIYFALGSLGILVTGGGSFFAFRRRKRRFQSEARETISEAKQAVASIDWEDQAVAITSSEKTEGTASYALSQAQEQQRHGQYKKAKQTAEKSLSLVDKQKDVLDRIEQVEQTIAQNIPGAKSNKARERISEAKKKFRNAEFEEAEKIAEQAQEFADPTLDFLLSNARKYVDKAQSARETTDYETAIEAWQGALDEYEHALERADAREKPSAAVDIQDSIDEVEARLYDTRLELLDTQTRELAAIADMDRTTLDTSDIIPLLINEDAEVREKTADVLALRSKVEPRALRSHVPALLTALEDDKQVIRDRVTTCLEKLAVDYNEAAENDPMEVTEDILDIAQLLTVDHPAIRKPASSALRAVAISDPEAVASRDFSVIPELIELLSADDPELRADAATTLAAIAQEEPDAVRDVAVHLAAHIDDKRAIQRPTLRALARVDGFTVLDERHVESLESLRDLQDNEHADDELREAVQTAVRNLERYRAEQLLEPDRIDSWDDAVDDLQILLTRDDSETRHTAARAAATLTETTTYSAAETGLVECLTDLLSDDLCRESAARALANIADIEPKALSFDTLWKLTATEFDSDVRRSAAKAITTISEDEPSSVVDHSDRILSLLEDDNPALRHYAVTLMSALADHSPSKIASAVPRLLDLVSSDYPTTREQAFTALVTLSETNPDRLRSGVPLFVTALEAERESIQEMAYTILSRISENAATQANANTSTVTDDLSDLVPLLEINDPTLCKPALEAINEVAKEHPDAVTDAVPELIDLLDATQKNIRKTATETLAVIADTHPDTIVEAKEALLNRFQEDATRESAIRAVAALAKVAPDELRDETSKIAVLLNDDDTQVQLYACEALGHIGGDLALRRLREARETADYEVQVVAENTIQRIEESEDQIQTREIPRDAVKSRMGAGVGDRLRTKLPDHEVIEWIGSGGNADVHKVRLTESDEVVALKVPRWEGTLSREAADRFVDEAKTWSKLDDHEHIVDVVDWGTSPYPWLLLEYMPASLNKASSRLSLDEKFNIIVTVADALEYAHSRGVIHLDLKPANILLTADDKAKIADWGLARVLLKHTHTRMGLTPPYSAPEQLTKGEGEIDRSTDIYQLGVLTFQLITGELPFEADRPIDLQTQILEKEPSPPSTLNPNIPEGVDEVILQALAKDQATRYEAAVLFRNALERFTNGNTGLL